MTQIPVLAFQSLHALGPLALETPACLPLFTPAFLPWSFKVCGAQPIFVEIACQRDTCLPALSWINRMGPSRISCENLPVVLLIMLHPNQELDPPENMETEVIPEG